MTFLCGVISMHEEPRSLWMTAHDVGVAFSIVSELPMRCRSFALFIYPHIGRCRPVPPGALIDHGEGFPEHVHAGAF